MNRLTLLLVALSIVICGGCTTEQHKVSQVRSYLASINVGTSVKQIQSDLHLNSPEDVAYPSRTDPVYRFSYRSGTLTIGFAAERVGGEVKTTNPEDFVFVGAASYSEFLGPPLPSTPVTTTP